MTADAPASDDRSGVGDATSPTGATDAASPTGAADATSSPGAGYWASKPTTTATGSSAERQFGDPDPTARD